MKYLPKNVRASRDDVRGFGYIVRFEDGHEEWYPRAWQATARARGWMLPYGFDMFMARHIPVENSSARKGKG